MRPAKARLEALLASVPANQTIPITVLQALGSWDKPWFDRVAIDRALRAIHAIGIWASTKEAGGETHVVDLAEGDLENKIWYEEALNAYKAKGVINGKEFDEIIASVESATGILNDPGLRQRLYDQTFTMVREGNQAIIENVAAAMRKTISSQGTAADFLHDINDVYKNAGIADQQFWYSELVYNNAANRAYQEGLDAGAAQMAQDGTLWGYEWQHSGNPNPRPSHKALNGWAAPADDPRWAQIGTPPIGHNCACRRFPVTHWDARRRKLDPAPPTPVVNDGPGAGKDAIEVLDTVPGERFGKSDWNTLNRPLLNPSYDLPQSKYVGPAPDPAAAKSIPKPAPKPIAPTQPGDAGLPTGMPSSGANAPTPLGQAKTIEEAQEQAKNRFPHMDFDFKGADIEVINPTLKQFEKLAEEYPDVADRMTTLNLFDPAKEGEKQWMAFCTGDGKRIALNAEKYHDANKMVQKMTLGSINYEKAKGHPYSLCNNWESIMSHEFGHAVHAWLKMQKADVAFIPACSASGFGTVSGTTITWSNVHKATKSLSKYATTNERESFAEGFTLLKHPSLKTKKPLYVKRLESFLSTVADSSNWSPTKWFSDLPYGSDEKEQAAKLIAALKKKLHLDEKM